MVNNGEGVLLSLISCSICKIFILNPQSFIDLPSVKLIELKYFFYYLLVVSRPTYKNTQINRI